MVVGETARAANFSLGGYERNTNPELAKAGVYYFRDVTSCGTATAVSVPCMFSDLPRDEFETSRAAHRTRCSTSFSGPACRCPRSTISRGARASGARVPTREAQVDHPESCVDGECRDDALLFALPAELPKMTGDGLIVLHSMGSHGPTYHLRVTPEFEVFKPVCPTERIEACSREQIVNSYDNSIVYTDHVLAGLIEELRARQDTVDSVLLYVSDHGESLGENGLYLHGQPYLIAPDVQKKVPMMLWFSTGAESRLGIADECLRDRLAVPASHDNVSHTLLGLLDVGTSVYRPGLDLLRDCRTGGGASPSWILYRRE